MHYNVMDDSIFNFGTIGPSKENCQGVESRKKGFGLHFAEFLWFRMNKEAAFEALVKCISTLY